MYVSSLAGLSLGRRCGVCVCMSSHWLASLWAVGVECVYLSPHWQASRWAVGVECVCICLLTGWPLVGP